MATLVLQTAPVLLPRLELELVASVDANNPVVGDLRLVGGTLSFLSDLGFAVAQRLRVRFQCFRGEWFANAREGIPYYQSILGHKFAPAYLTSVFRAVLKSTVGVAAVNACSVTYDRSARLVSVAFDLKLEDASTFRSIDFPPFVIEVP